MHINELKIVGCGGHSKVVLDALSLYEPALPISLCDSNTALLGKEIFGIPINTTMDVLADFKGHVHIAIGNNKIREEIIRVYDLRSRLFTVIHPAALVSQYAAIEQGAFIAGMAILGPECSIGVGCIINHGAVVDHEVKIDSCTHIAPNCTLGGNVTIGKGVLIGAGATILPGVTIGNGAIIGAGAVVIRDVEANTQVVGVPAVQKE